MSGSIKQSADAPLKVSQLEADIAAEVSSVVSALSADADSSSSSKEELAPNEPEPGRLLPELLLAINVGLVPN